MKVLQEQYRKDFPNYGCMMGKSAYTCLEDGETCADGICNRVPKERKSQLMAVCPYRRSLAANLANPCVIHNFDSFFFQKCVSRQFTDRELLIIDEAHNIENKFVDFFSFSVRSDGQYGVKDRKFPVFDEADDYLPIIREERERLAMELYQILRKTEEGTLDIDEYRSAQRLERMVGKMDGFLRKSKGNEFIVDILDHDSGNTVKIRPVYANEYVYEALFDGSQKVLMLSATILDKEMFCNNVGLNPEEVSFIQVPSIFPAKNRPVLAYWDETGSMSYREIRETLPKMVRAIETIMQKVPNWKGIIHTGSERVANYIRDNADRALIRRMTFRKDFYTVDEMLEAHERKPGSFIVASGLKEGVDLKDDLSRVQIICKVPYLDLSDKRTKRRMTLDRSWYGYMTALLLIQSFGRSVRSPTDRAITYILDSAFQTFYNMNRRFIPDYVRDSLHL